MNRRVYNRALSVLTPPQLSAVATFRKNMATAQVAGLKMTQRMLQGNQKGNRQRPRSSTGP